MDGFLDQWTRKSFSIFQPRMDANKDEFTGCDYSLKSRMRLRMVSQESADYTTLNSDYRKVLFFGDVLRAAILRP